MRKLDPRWASWDNRVFNFRYRAYKRRLRWGKHPILLHLCHPFYVLRLRRLYHQWPFRVPPPPQAGVRRDTNSASGLPE